MNEKLGLLHEIQIVEGRICERSQLPTTRRGPPSGAAAASPAQASASTADAQSARITI
jgi:hypothetical protein